MTLWLEVTTTGRTVLRGHSIRKVENHWKERLWMSLIQGDELLSNGTERGSGNSSSQVQEVARFASKLQQD